MNPINLQEGKKGESYTCPFTRRDFLTKVMPACTIGCLGLCGAVSLSGLRADTLPDPEKHKFDMDYPQPLTLRQYMSRQLTSCIEPLKAVESEMGEERLLRILHDFSIKKGEEQGDAFAKQYPDRDFSRTMSGSETAKCSPSLHMKSSRTRKRHSRSM